MTKADVDQSRSEVIAVGEVLRDIPTARSDRMHSKVDQALSLLMNLLNRLDHEAKEAK